VVNQGDKGELVGLREKWNLKTIRNDSSASGAFIMGKSDDDLADIQALLLKPLLCVPLYG
jgi:hypothetical protein